VPTIKVKGMSCNHCATAVIKALDGLDGVFDTTVNLEAAEASFNEESPVDKALIAEAVKKAGYEVV